MCTHVASGVRSADRVICEAVSVDIEHDPLRCVRRSQWVRGCLGSWRDCGTVARRPPSVLAGYSQAKAGRLVVTVRVPTGHRILGGAISPRPESVGGTAGLSYIASLDPSANVSASALESRACPAASPPASTAASLAASREASARCNTTSTRVGLGTSSSAASRASSTVLTSGRTHSPSSPQVAPSSAHTWSAVHSLSGTGGATDRLVATGRV